MSRTDPELAGPLRKYSPVASEEQYQLIWKGLASFIERSTPWIFEAGIWIFGSLIAFNLLIIASLITVGPVDTPIMVATAAFALALPLNVAGLFLLRLTKEMKDARLEDELAQAFNEAGFVSDEIPAPPALEAMRKRRTGIVLLSAPGILAVSAVLTLTGMAATLWYMAWWIAVSFCAMVVLCLFLVVLTITSSPPPDSKEDKKDKKRRSIDRTTRQARERDRKKEQRI